MASYDLKCNTCGKDFEVFCLGFLKDDVKVCPDCGGRDVQQRFTGFGGVTGLGGGGYFDSGRGSSGGGCSSHSGFS